MSTTDTRAQSDTLIGHQVGRYVVRAYVGEEELGNVYAANELPMGRVVSLKVLHTHLSDSREAFARFGREMMATATVNHPNTVQMLDFGDHRGIFHYIVLEHLDARTLAEELAKGPFPADRTAGIAAQIASALSAAHAESIIHRNLSPQNILLLRNAKSGDYVKVRDFGLSRLQSEQDEDVDLTAVGTRVGTTAYMAPEYIMSSLVDPRGDLYALGALMFEMLTGQTPFTGKQSAIIEGHCSGPVPRPSQRARNVPAWMDDLVFRLLQKEPDDRPATAGEVFGLLRQGSGKRLDAPELTPLDAEKAIARRATESTAPARAAAPSAAKVAVGAGLVLLFAAIAVVAITIIAILVLF